MQKIYYNIDIIDKITCDGLLKCPQCPPPPRIGASSDIPTRYQTKTASSATGMPISEVQMKNQTKPVCSITKPENPARMLPGKAQSEVSRPNWLAACSTDASVDI